MTVENTDFGRVADDLRRAATAFALLTSNASAFGVALNSFREFQKQLISTNAVAQGTAKNFAQMERAAKSFALATTTSAVEAVDALQNLAQAGFTASESLQAMTGVLLLASATLSDVGQAADLISANIRAFNLEATDTTRVSNLFVAAITSGLASMDKLTFAFRQVAPVADVANLSIEETTAFLNELFNVGLRGEQAGTALRNVIIRLVRPTGEAAQIMRELGIASVDATGNLRPLEQILRELSAANLGEADLAKIFENEALAGALTLMKSVSTTVDGTTTAYRKMLDEISGTQDALILTLKNLTSLDAQLKLLRNSFIDVAIGIGEQLAPYVEQFAAYLRDLMQAYRDLDPATKQFYTQILLIGAAVVGFLGIINALILLFGTGVTAVAGFAVSLGGLPIYATVIALAGLTGGVTGAIAAFAALVVGMKVYAAYSAGTLLPAIRALTTAMFFLAATNPIVAGIAAVAAVAAVATGAFFALRGEAAKTAEELKAIEDTKVRVSLEFDRKAAQGGFGDLASRETDNLISLIEGMVNSDLISAIGENDPFTLFASAQKAQEYAIKGFDQQQEREKALASSMGDLLQTRNDINKLIDKYLADSDDSALERWYNSEILSASRDDLLKGVLEEMEKRGDVSRAEEIRLLIAKEKEIGEDAKALEELIATTKEAEIKFLKDFTQRIATAEAELPAIYSDLTDDVRKYLQSVDQATIDAIAKGLADGDKAVTVEAFLEEILTRQGVDPGFRKEILSRNERERVRKIVADLQSIVSDLADVNEEARIASLEYTSENSKKLAEALAAGVEAGNARIEQDLNESLKSFTKEFGGQLITVINQNQVGIQQAINRAVASAASQGLNFDITAKDGIDAIIGGSALIEAINGRIDADSTAEEIAAIAKEEGEKYQKLMLLILEEVVKASEGAISPEQLKVLEEIVNGRIKAIGDAVIAGSREGTDNQEAIRKRFQEQADKAKREAEKAEKEAREAFKRLRSIEDLFLDAANQTRDARKKFVDATRGLGVNDRVSFNLDFDISGINEDFDKQITDFKRKIEDLEMDKETDPAIIEKLKEQYGQLVTEVERARDAEIAAATSFESSMQRRSKALDLFIRDLQDIGLQSKDTFTQVGAGIASAFAEYQKDLVTLIDITKDATTGLLDTITTGIGDFIFDNENAWENFKDNMLNISRQIFEGFTKAFLQQAISSLSGGEGSILGNALQPSPYGDTGTPGVGTGGILGKLFPGLAGGQAQGASPEVAQLQAISTSTQSSSASLQTSSTALQTVSTSLQSVVASLQSIAAAATSGLGDVASGFAGVVPGVGAVAGAAGSVGSAAYKAGSGIIDGVVTSLQDGIVETASALKVDPLDLAKVISYETGGTFDPMQAGPTTQWGQHRGLIQFGEPQAAQFGVDFSSEMSALTSQLGPDGAIVKYLTASGFKPGMSGLDLYSTINAGAPGRYSASDALNGGAPGDVADKYFNQMEGHLDNAQQLFADFNGNMTSVVGQTQQLTSQLGSSVSSVASDALNAQPLSATGQQLLGAVNYVQPTNAMQQVGANPLAALTGQGSGQPGSDIMAMSQQFAQTFQQFATEIANTLNQFGTQFAQALNSALQQMGSAGGVGFAGISGGMGGLGGLGGILGGLGGLLGFAEGGYTGAGGKYQPAGIVHAGEFVFDSQDTKELLPLFDALHKGKIKGRDLMELLRGDIGYSDGGLVSALGGIQSITGGSRNTASSDDRRYKESRGGGVTNVHVVYNINGSNTDSFAKSANQHAKTLMATIERAKRNN